VQLVPEAVSVGAGVPEATGIAGQRLDASRRLLTGGRRLSEAALVRAARRGSEAAVEELFDRHWRDAYRVALLVTGDAAAAEDIAQEAFLAALRALPRFDLRRPLGPWLHRIVVNRAIDWCRARKLRAEVAPGAAPETAATEPRPVVAFGDEAAAALLRLAPEQRAVVVMRYLLELTPGEIAKALDIPRGTVNSRLRRGLDALGELMREPA
jgi:RNA polymerase sigma-70 factor, ECF subfamily